MLLDKQRYSNHTKDYWASTIFFFHFDFSRFHGSRRPLWKTAHNWLNVFLHCRRPQNYLLLKNLVDPYKTARISKSRLSSLILKVAETSNQIIMKLLKLGHQSILSFSWILKLLGPVRNGGVKSREFGQGLAAGHLFNFYWLKNRDIFTRQDNMIS